MPTDVSAASSTGITIRSQKSFDNGLSAISITDEVSNGLTYDSDSGVYYGVVDLAASGSTTLDLRSGLVDRHGDALVFTKVYLVFITLTANNEDYAASSVKIGGAATNVLPIFDDDADTETIFAGDYFIRSRRLGVTVDATNRNLKVLNLDSVESARLIVAIIGDL